MFYLFLFLIIMTSCFSDARFGEIEELEQKLNSFHLDIKKNGCNQDKVASLFLRGTKLLEQIKDIERSMKRSQGKDHTAQFITIDQLKSDLKIIIIEIEAYTKQCANGRKSYVSHEETTPYNITRVKEIGIAEEAHPRYNHPSDFPFEEIDKTNNTSK